MPRSAENARFNIGDPRSEIPAAERDRALLLAGWPDDTARTLKEGSPESGWEQRGAHLFRRIAVHGEGDGAKKHLMWEALMRFPNAPLYTTHDLLEKPFAVTTPWPNFHTMRILGHDSDSRGRPDNPDKQIKHVYLLHNGLNETNDLLFHYRLAGWIINKRPDAVCILRPLPGHLTRFPFHGPYAATPLDSYLRDPADLFRQFLRYMLETQWLLSALVPRSQYLVAAGTELLGDVPSSGHPSGRASTTVLTREMSQSWETAFLSNKAEGSGGAQANARKSGKTSKSPNKAEASGQESYSKEPITPQMIRSVITELRELLNWEPVLSSRPPSKHGKHNGPAEPESPCIHVVGYSIGGFVAQAVFFAWPFAVSSCTNLFAGGALRDLAPTAFAHPEEWQAVLHGMRYELDRASRDKYLTPTRDGFIAGINERDFGYFTRIFYEVFLQYYRGGYSSRVSEFSRRLLFVVGGDDPIVRTKNVLDAGPPQGVTLLQIANMTHFPGGHLRGSSDARAVEREQRMHWLPEVGRVIANFSERSEGLLHRTLAECWGAFNGGRAKQAAPPAASGGGGGDRRASAQADEQDGMLDSAAFAKELNRLVRRVGEAGKDPADGGHGWLLISRNEVPPVFLGVDGFLVHGQSVHHSEEQITSYIDVLRDRSAYLIEKRPRVSLLIPTESERWFKHRKERERFLSKSETASAARIPSDETAALMWRKFKEDWIAEGAVGMVDTDEHKPDDLGEIGRVEAKRLGLEELPLTSLPDAWIALSEKVCKQLRRAAMEDERKHNEESVVEWATRLAKGWGAKQTEERDARAAKERGFKAAPDKAEEELQEWIDRGEVMAVTVSAAELNPRYRGHRLLKARDVRKVLIHWALAYQASDLAKVE